MKATRVIEKDLGSLHERLARDIATWAGEAIAARGRFTFVLSGGSTPRGLYERLARDRSIDGSRVHFFWSDERHVAPSHPDSNFGMARDAMLAPLAIPESNIHRMRGEMADAASAAAEHDAELARFFALSPDAIPRFDLMLLGMGADGHTASLFPGSPALSETRARVLAPWVPHLNAFRLTLTIPVLADADRVLFLIAGADKSATLAHLPDHPLLPASLVSSASRNPPLWYLDQKATKEVTATSGEDGSGR